jgi:sensor c-di-GMP phosphodiesterase-like protein
LAYLHDLAIDAIKIDRAFTKSIGTEAVTMAVLPQILAMAESLNLQVVVEGIETTEQARYFTGDDKHYLAQGWLFGHPLSASDFQALLAEEAKNMDVGNKGSETPNPVSG